MSVVQCSGGRQTTAQDRPKHCAEGSRNDLMHVASEKGLAVSNDGVGAWLGALLKCVGIG